MERILTNFADYFHKSSIWMDAIRAIGYEIVKLLQIVADAMISLFDKTYDLLDFTRIPAVDKFINEFKPVFIALFCVSLLILGVMLIIQTEKPKKLLKNILISLVVISSSTFLISSLNKIVISGKDAVNLTSESTSTDVVKNNLIDLLYVDKKNELSKFPEYYNKLSTQVIKSIDITEKVTSDVDGISETAEEVFDNYVVISNDGKVDYEEFKSGWFSVFDPPYYYRYDIHFFTIYVTYLAMIIVYVCTSFKVIRLVYEIVVHRVLAYLYAADITSGQRLVKILDSLLNTYIVLFMVTVFLKVYQLANSFIAQQNYNSFIKCFFLICIAFAVIDGPNIIQQITGIDAGLSSGFGKIAAAYTMGRGLAGAGRHVLLGNPYTGRGGILNSQLGVKARTLGKEGLGAVNDMAKAGIASGVGYAAGAVTGKNKDTENTSDIQKKSRSTGDNSSNPGGTKDTKGSEGIKEMPLHEAKQHIADPKAPLSGNGINESGHGNDLGEKMAKESFSKSENDNSKKAANSNVPISGNSGLDISSTKEKKGKDPIETKGGDLKKEGYSGQGNLKGSEEERAINNSNDLNHQEGFESLIDLGEKDEAENKEQKSFIDELLEPRKERIKGTIGVPFKRTRETLRYGYKKGYEKGQNKKLK